jgi:hypothetical protein
LRYENLGAEDEEEAAVRDRIDTGNLAIAARVPGEEHEHIGLTTANIISEELGVKMFDQFDAWDFAEYFGITRLQDPENIKLVAECTKDEALWGLRG